MRMPNATMWSHKKTANSLASRFSRPAVVRLLMVVAVATRGVASGPSSNACLEPVASKPLSVTISRGRPPCIAITVRPDEAIQVIVEHPEDVSLRVSGEWELTLADGFEFGTETIT